MFGGVLEWRPRPTPGCSAIEEEEEVTDRPSQLSKTNVMEFLLHLLRI
jgi:hypothetical protein